MGEGPLQPGDIGYYNPYAPSVAGQVSAPTPVAKSPAAKWALAANAPPVSAPPRTPTPPTPGGYPADLLSGLSYFDPSNVQQRAQAAGVTFHQQLASESAQKAHANAWDAVVRMNVVGPGGDPGDSPHAQGVAATQLATAQQQMTAAQTSPFRNSYQNAPSLADSMQRIGQSAAPPDPSRLTYVPGMPPDTLMDSATGEIYVYKSATNIKYVGNILNPQYTELQRGSATVMGTLTQRGVLSPATPRPIKGDHGWKTLKARGTPSLGGINVNAPTNADIATNLSNVSSTAWAMVDRGTKRAIGVGSVLASVASAGLGAAAAPALGIAAGGFGAGAATVGGAAVGGGLGMLAGQYAARGGNTGGIDWNAVVKSALGSAVSSGIGQALAPVIAGAGQGLGFTGANLANFKYGAGLVMGHAFKPVTGPVVAGASNLIVPKKKTTISAYAPYPRMRPDQGDRIMGRLGY